MARLLCVNYVLRSVMNVSKCNEVMRNFKHGSRVPDRFPILKGFSVKSCHSTSSVVAASEMDPVQVALLDEQCIVVDENDRAIGMDTKKNCHIFTDNKGILHRAFSVFLFDLEGKLLLQQRSQKKITFPGCYSNSCCSHPLYTPLEMEECDYLGVKRAAQRRLHFELGIPSEEVFLRAVSRWSFVVSIPLDSIDVITRFHYSAPSGGPWGEHEISYALFIRRNVTVKLNSNEVQDYAFIDRRELTEFLEYLSRNGVPLTPWFKLISQKLLTRWWDNLSQIETIKDDKIHRLS